MNKKVKIILALFVVIIAVIGFFYLYTAKTRYNLTEKFGLHGRIIDIGDYENEESLIEKFSVAYEAYKENGENLFLVLLDKDNIRLMSYGGVSQGEISLISGKTTQNLEVNKRELFSQKLIKRGNNIEVVLDGQKFNLNVDFNKNKYLIILNDGGELNVIEKN